MTEEVKNSPLYARIKSDFVTLRSMIFDIFKLTKELRMTNPNYQMHSWFRLQSQVSSAYYSDPYTSGNSLAAILNAKMYAALYLYLGLPLNTLLDMNFDLAALKNKCDEAIQASKNRPAELAEKTLPAKDIPEDDKYSVMLRNFNKKLGEPDSRQGNSSQPEKKRSREQDNDRAYKRQRTKEYTHQIKTLNYTALTQFLSTMLRDCGFTRKENNSEREFLLSVLKDIAKRIIESKVAIDRNDVFTISAIRLQAIVDAKVPVAWVPRNYSDDSIYSPILAFLTFKIAGGNHQHLSQFIVWMYKLLFRVSDQFPGIKKYGISETMADRRRQYEVYRSSDQDSKVIYHIEYTSMEDYQRRNFIYRCVTGCTLKTILDANVEAQNNTLVIEAIRNLLEERQVTVANAQNFGVDRFWIEQVNRLPKKLYPEDCDKYFKTLEFTIRHDKKHRLYCSIRLWKIAVALNSHYCPEAMVTTSEDETRVRRNDDPVVEERMA